MSKVILSPPKPPVCWRSGERHASRRLSATASGLKLLSSKFPNLLLTKSTACWLLTTSHTPSQAMTMNSSFGCRGYVWTSGVLTINWSDWRSMLFCL